MPQPSEAEDACHCEDRACRQQGNLKANAERGHCGAESCLADGRDHYMDLAARNVRARLCHVLP